MILLAHSESNLRFLSMSVLQVVIAAISSVDAPNDVKFAISFVLHLHSICLSPRFVSRCQLSPGLGWVRKIEDVLEQRDPRLIGAFFQRDNEKRMTPNYNLIYAFY